MLTHHSRRGFLAGLTATGAMSFAGSSQQAFAEPPPETATLRLPKFFRAVCEAPKNVVRSLLEAEGFTDLRYVEPPAGADPFAMLASGELDFNVDFPATNLSAIDSGLPIKVLTGVHSGCLELIATENIKSVRELKGKRVGVDRFLSHPHMLVTLMAAYVGLDPKLDIEWVENKDVLAMQLFIDGKVDAFLGGAPEPQELRKLKIGHTLVNTTTDPPWSRHFCCMLAGGADSIERRPAATKRAMRAILKGADLCVSDPEGVARQMVERQFTDNYDFALQALKEVRFDRWREFDPEDSMRFYALRLHEVGFIKSNPNDLIAKGTDWRFLNEIKRELKA